MKKKIIIEEDNNPKESIINNKLIGQVFETFLYLLGYAIILILVSFIFKKSLYINRKYLGLYALLASILPNVK